MHILIVTHHFPPLNTMGANRLYAFAKTWQKMGHKITILTTKKYQYDGKIDFLPQEEAFATLNIVTVPYAQWFTKRFEFRDEKYIKKEPSKTLLTSLKSFIRKIRKRYIGLFFDIHDLWVKAAVKEAKLIISNQKVDLLFSSYSPSSTHIVASKLKALYPELFWVADYRDLWSGNPYYENENFFSYIQRKKEKNLLQNATVVTTVSKPWQSYLEHFLEKPVYLCMNGYDKDALSNLDSKRVYPEDGKKRIIYTGTLYPHKQNVSSFLKAVKRLIDDAVIKDNFEIIFYGDSGDIKHLIASYGIESVVRYYGFVSREESLRAQRDADGLLYFGWEDANSNSLNATGVLSAKVFEYIASNTEIFAIGGSRASEASWWIYKSGAGEVYEEDVDAIYNALKRLILGRKKVLQRDSKIVELCRRDVQAKALLETIQKRMP